MIIEQSQHIIDEISKVFIGKDEIINDNLCWRTYFIK